MIHLVRVRSSVFATHYVRAISFGVVLVCGGCTCIHSRHANSEPVPLATVTVRELNGPDRLVEIPPTGLPLSSVVRKYERSTVIATPIPNTADGMKDLFAALNSIFETAKDINQPESASLTAVELADRVKADDAGADGYRRLVDRLNHHQFVGNIVLLDGPGIDKTTAAADACLRWICGQPTGQASPRKLENSSQLLEAIGTDRVQILQPTATPSEGPVSSPIMVLVRRRLGHEIVVPLAIVHESAVGAILLQNRDTVITSYAAGLWEAADDSVAESRILVTGLKDGLVDSNYPMLQLRLVDTLRYYEGTRSDQANVAIVTRSTPLGTTREYVLPLISDQYFGSYRGELNQLYSQIPTRNGDWLHFDRLETLPVVLASRTEFLRLQRIALDKKRLARSGKPERLNDLLVSKNASEIRDDLRNAPLAKQVRSMSRIVGERIGSGLDSLGAAAGIR